MSVFLPSLSALGCVCRFHLQLATFSSDRGSALLNVVEANPFKHLTHLSLKLLHANDSVLKKYLAECLIALRVSWGRGRALREGRKK